MVQVKKTNPVPTVTDAKVQPPDMLRYVLVTGKATHTAALSLCYAAAGFILLVNHFRDAKADGYMNKADAIEYLSKQIAEQANVKGKMLDIYLRNASILAGALTGSSKLFSSTIQEIGTAATPEEIGGLIADWFDKTQASKPMHKKVESLSGLSEALGYSTGRPAKPTPFTADKAPSTIASAMKKVEAIVGAGKGQVREQVIAQAVVNNAKSPATFAREAIKKITDTDELKALTAFINDWIKSLAKLSQQAEANLQVRTKQHAETVKRHKQHGKGEKKGQRTPVQRTSV